MLSRGRMCESLSKMCSCIKSITLQQEIPEHSLPSSSWASGQLQQMVTDMQGRLHIAEKVQFKHRRVRVR